VLSTILDNLRSEDFFKRLQSAFPFENIKVDAGNNGVFQVLIKFTHSDTGNVYCLVCNFIFTEYKEKFESQMIQIYEDKIFKVVKEFKNTYTKNMYSWKTTNAYLIVLSGPKLPVRRLRFK
jgi:hypothetical protein